MRNDRARWGRIAGTSSRGLNTARSKISLILQNPLSLPSLHPIKKFLIGFISQGAEVLVQEQVHQDIDTPTILCYQQLVTE